MKEEIEMVRERESLELLQSESLESVTNISGILSLLALPELPQDDPIFEHQRGLLSRLGSSVLCCASEVPLHLFLLLLLWRLIGTVARGLCLRLAFTDQRSQVDWLVIVILVGQILKVHLGHVLHFLCLS
jgi:hypothetical protein